MHQQQRWIKKMAWPVGSFLFLAVMLLCSSVPALASSGPKTAYPKPFANRIKAAFSSSYLFGKYL